MKAIPKAHKDDRMLKAHGYYKEIQQWAEEAEQEVKELREELDLLKHFFTWDVDNLKALKDKNGRFTDDNTILIRNYDRILIKNKH